MVKKLFKLKSWLSIDDAARYLSAVLEENVSEADILQLALDDHLKVSVNFVNDAPARRAERVQEEDIKYTTYLPPDGREEMALPEDGPIYEEDNGPFRLNQKIYQLNGVWDLLVEGGARLDLESKYHVFTGGSAVTRNEVYGHVFVSGGKGDLYQLQEEVGPQNNTILTEAKRLPKDSRIVVLRRHLEEFEAGLAEPADAQSRPLGTTERATLLTIIAALAKEASIPISKTSKAADLIADITQRNGTPVSKRAIEDHLKRIPDALERRAKS